MFCLECLHIRLGFPAILTDQQFLQWYNAYKDFREVVEACRPRVIQYLSQRTVCAPAEVIALRHINEQVQAIFNIYTPKEYLLEFRCDPQDIKHPLVEIENEEGNKEQVHITRARRELVLQCGRGFHLHEHMMPLQLNDHQPNERYTQLMQIQSKDRGKLLSLAKRHKLPTDASVREVAAAKAQKVAENFALVTQAQPPAPQGAPAWKSPSTPGNVRSGMPSSWGVRDTSKASTQTTPGKKGASIDKSDAPLLRRPAPSRGKVAAASSAKAKLEPGVALQNALTVAASKKASGLRGGGNKADALPAKRSRIEAVSISGTQKDIQLLHEVSTKATTASRSGKAVVSPEEPFDCVSLMLGDGDKRKPNGVAQGITNNYGIIVQTYVT